MIIDSGTYTCYAIAKIEIFASDTLGNFTFTNISS